MTPTRPSIALRHPHNRTTVAADDVYFTFADGRFSYDCVSCGAKCCYGHGYLASGPEELRLQLEQRPSISAFVELQHASDVSPYHVANCPGGCFFLTPNALCRIHQEFGPQAKPETCRLFPFNNIRRCGRFLIVAPHESLCPIRVEEPGSSSSCSSYNLLLEAMTAKGVEAQVGMAATSGSAEEAIAVERRIVGIAEEHLDKADFAAFAMAQLMHGEAHTVSGRVSGSQDQHHRIERAMHNACSLFDESVGEAFAPDRELAKTMIALTPFLRSYLIFSEPGNSGLLRDEPLNRESVPEVLLGAYVLASCAKRAGVATITFQTVSRIFRGTYPLLCLLPFFDRPVAWARDELIEAPDFGREDFRDSFLRLAKSLLPAQQLRRRAPLGALLQDSFEGGRVDRIVFLKLVARVLHRRVTPLDRAQPQRERRAPARMRARAAVQRWLVANLDTSQLMRIYPGARRKAGAGLRGER